jgi:hypothetical protein
MLLRALHASFLVERIKISSSRTALEALHQLIILIGVRTCREIAELERHTTTVHRKTPVRLCPPCRNPLYVGTTTTDQPTRTSLRGSAAQPHRSVHGASGRDDSCNDTARRLAALLIEAADQVDRGSLRIHADTPLPGPSSCLGGGPRNTAQECPGAVGQVCRMTLVAGYLGAHAYRGNPPPRPAEAALTAEPTPRETRIPKRSDRCRTPG